MQVLSAGAIRLDASRAFILQCSLVRRSEIRRTAEKPGDILRESIQHFARCFAPGNSLWVGWKYRKVAIPSCGKLSPLHQINLGGQLRKLYPILGKEFSPLKPGLITPGTHSGSKVIVDAVRHEELRVLRPAICALGQADLVIAQWLAVSFRRVLLMRRTVADMAIQNNEGRSLLRLSENLKGAFDPIDVVGITNAQDIPPVRQESRRNIFRERDTCVPFDRDVVVVVNPTEIVEAQVPGEGRRFRGYPFHHAAIPAYGINVVVKNLKVRSIVMGSQPPLSDSHPHARRNALSERTGRRFNSRDPVIFRVSGCPTVELPKSADVIQRHGGLTKLLVVSVDRLSLCEVENGPE